MKYNTLLLLLITILQIAQVNAQTKMKTHNINIFKIELPENVNAERSFKFTSEKDKSELKIEFEEFPLSIKPRSMAENVKEKYSSLVTYVSTGEITIGKSSLGEVAKTIIIMNFSSEKTYLHFAALRHQEYIMKISFTCPKLNEIEWNQILESLDKVESAHRPKQGNKIFVARDIQVELAKLYTNQDFYHFSDTEYLSDANYLITISKEPVYRELKDAIYTEGDQKVVIKKLPLDNPKGLLNETHVELTAMEGKNVIRKSWLHLGQVKTNTGSLVNIQLVEKQNPDFGNQNWKKIIESIKMQ